MFNPPWAHFVDVFMTPDGSFYSGGGILVPAASSGDRM
jgi:hypothetical protein